MAVATPPGKTETEHDRDIGGERSVGTVLRSVNGGESWQPYGHGLPAGGVAAFAIDPAGRTVYGATNGAGVDALELIG